MRNAIWVLCIFAATWGAIGLSPYGLPAMAIPIAISAALLGWTSRIALPGRTRNEGKRIGRLIAMWSSVQGVAIFATFALCQRLGIPDAAVPILAIIVGLHFLPLARGIPTPIYDATGLGMIAVGAVALLLPPAIRYAATGIPCATILWVTCLVVVARGRRSVFA